jgi:ubiquinone/menaquinone biosynthesis C-methylase UbiE
MKRNIKEEGAEFWNQNPCGGAWGTYQEFMTWIQRTEPYIYQILSRHEWKGKQVLEVGCGQGATLNYLPPFGAYVYGIDMSEVSLAQAKTGAIELGHVERVRLSKGDAEHLNFSAEFFDSVLSLGVLHHTSDTEGAVQQIYRVLKPGGTAIVMLYRSGNPKWWFTRFLRGLSFTVDKVYQKEFVIANRLRRGQTQGSRQGTALLELFGVPILKAFSNDESRKMFANFSSVMITNYQPGFERNCDILPILKPLRPIFRYIDSAMQSRWGFYQVIEAIK